MFCSLQVQLAHGTVYRDTHTFFPEEFICSYIGFPSRLNPKPRKVLDADNLDTTGQEDS